MLANIPLINSHVVTLNVQLFDCHILQLSTTECEQYASLKTNKTTPP